MSPASSRKALPISSLGLSLVLLGVLLMLSAVHVGVAQAAGVEAGRWLRVDLAEAKGLQDPTGQLDRGSIVYRLNCVSCHGDVLEGLTDEWRSKWIEDHQDCWQSKCHSFNHPPDGFIIPRWAPPLVGEEVLGKFGSAAGFQAYVRVAMPFQEPGVLTDEQYWDVTAYVLDYNGIRWGQGDLGPENGASVILTSDQPNLDQPGASPTAAPSPVATVEPTASALPGPAAGAEASGRGGLLAAATAGMLVLGGGLAFIFGRRARKARG